MSSKVKKPKKPKPQPEPWFAISEDEYRFSSEYTTTKMGLIDMVDGQFFENLNNIVIRASRVTGHIGLIKCVL